MLAHLKRTSLLSLLAPKELYTWYCPMTIQHHPLFEHTPVLSNNFDYWCRDDFVDCDFDDNFRWQFLMTQMHMIHDQWWWYMMIIMIYDTWYMMTMMIYVLCFMICFMIWYDMFNLDIWWSWWYMIHDDDIYCWTCLIFMLMLILDLWLQAETPGVTYFGAYHRPPDGHF